MIVGDAIRGERELAGVGYALRRFSWLEVCRILGESRAAVRGGRTWEDDPVPRANA